MVGRGMDHFVMRIVGGARILAVLVAASCGCAPTSGPPLTVSSPFSIAARPLTSPTLTIEAPTNGSVQLVDSGGKTAVLLAFAVGGQPALRAHLYLDGTFAAVVSSAGTTGNATLSGVGPGLHTLGAVLADDAGLELDAPTARAVVRVAVVPPCVVAADCDDGLACSAQSCVAGVCSYVAVPGCCGSTFDCAAGVACAAANTAASACKACDDASACDDGNACTADTCVIGLGLCSHARPAQTCCSAADCPSDDPCQVGVCHEGSCALLPDLLRPDCCSPSTNPSCDDGASCTLDACSSPMPGWTRCSHSPNLGVAGCCDPYGGQTCQDSNPCTYDICGPNAQCVHAAISGCCTSQAGCDDGHPCTADACTFFGNDAVGLCSHLGAQSCCAFAADCDDGVACTVDACALANALTGTCTHALGAGCCVDDTDCDDAKSCTTDVCVNHQCLFGKPGDSATCCDSSQDCDDDNPCTLDTCALDTQTCAHVDGGDPSCCNDNSDCDTGACGVFGWCDASHQCVQTQAVSACESAQECDDNNSCTVDACALVAGCGQCTHQFQPGCCKADAQCQDGDPCTKDGCVDASCQHAKVPGCCINGASALAACDDDDPCTQDSCLGSACRHVAPPGSCCQHDSDCDDGVDCTLDTCMNHYSGGRGYCYSQAAVGCVPCDVAGRGGAGCDDGDTCTSDTCIGGLCEFTNVANCCHDDGDCDDDDACTQDVCAVAAGICAHPLVVPGCCTVGTSVGGTSCAHLDGPCVTGTCVAPSSVAEGTSAGPPTGPAQPSGTGQCVAVAHEPCTGPLNHCQDFAAAAQWAGLTWRPVDVSGKAATNWTLGPGGPLGADNAARFAWTPTRLNFQACLRSPVLVPPPYAGAQAPDVTIQLARAWALVPGAAPGLALQVVHWPTWSSDAADAAVLASLPLGPSEGPGPITLTLPGAALGGGTMRLGLCVAGPSSAQLASFAIDDVCVAAGKPPAFTLCPSARTVTAGQVVDIPLRAWDPDPKANLSFAAPQGVDFASLVPLGAAPGGEQRALLRVMPGDDDGGHHRLELQVDDGVLRGACTVDITVLATQGIVIWKPAEVPWAMAQPIVDGLHQLGRSAHVIEDLGTYVDLGAFDAVFVVLGVYPARHVLTANEAAKLSSYLQGAGRLYLEGGDTWAFDPKTPLHAMFAAKGVADAAPTGIGGALQGHASLALPSVAGPGSAAAPAAWSYDTSASFDNVIDLLGVTPGPGRSGLLRIAGGSNAWVQVAIAPPVAGYRAVASSVALAGVRPGALAPPALLARLLAFFDNGLPACAGVADCDDGDPCTVDVCLAGVCGVSGGCP